MRKQVPIKIPFVGRIEYADRFAPALFVLLCAAVFLIACSPRSEQPNTPAVSQETSRETTPSAEASQSAQSVDASPSPDINTSAASEEPKKKISKNERKAIRKFLNLTRLHGGTWDALDMVDAACSSSRLEPQIITAEQERSFTAIDDDYAPIEGTEYYSPKAVLVFIQNYFGKTLTFSEIQSTFNGDENKWDYQYCPYHDIIINGGGTMHYWHSRWEPKKIKDLDDGRIEVTADVTFGGAGGAGYLDDKGLFVEEYHNAIVILQRTPDSAFGYYLIKTTIKGVPTIRYTN